MAGTSADFYSLVQRRIWNDAGFRKLSKPAPNARDLFLYLLTTPHATQVPGLVALGESAMAEDLEWPLAGLRKALGELEVAGMVKVDRVARLLWLPNGMKHNSPKSPDNVLGWAKHWRMLPECDLLREAAAYMMQAFVARGGTFPQAFARTSGLPTPEPVAAPQAAPKEDPMVDPMGNPEGRPPPRHQTQEQTQEQDPKKHTHTSAGARESRPSSQTATTIALPFGPAEAEVVTADALLRAVSRHAMLSTLHEDRRWAMNAVGWLQAAGCRAEDAAAAVGAFVTDKAGAAPPDGPTLDAFVRENIGRYLKNAKQHGDAHRATARAAAERQIRVGARRGPTPQPGAFQILNKNPDPVSAEERERPLV